LPFSFGSAALQEKEQKTAGRQRKTNYSIFSKHPEELDNFLS
jgi:hypothetical protein